MPLTAEISVRKIREIESLHDLSRTLSSAFDSREIAEMIRHGHQVLTSKKSAKGDPAALQLTGESIENFVGEEAGAVLKSLQLK